MARSVLMQKSVKQIKNEKKAAKRAKFSKGADKFIGDEPILSGKISDTDFTLAMNWYNYNYAPKDTLPWVIEYMKSANYSASDLSAFKAAPEWRCGMTVGSICRLINNQVVVSEHALERVKRVIAECIAAGKAAQNKTESNKHLVSITPADRIKEKITNMIGDFEIEIDQFLANGFQSEFKPYDYMKKNDIKAAQAGKVVEFYKPLFLELQAAYSGKDPDLKEAYSKYSKANLKKYLDFVESLISNSESTAHVQRAARKPRKIKEKSVSQIIGKMKFLKESTEYKIASIDPSRIIKAQMLLVFNVKYRKFGIYYAASDAGFSVAGTTIQNFDEAKSLNKMLRKPNEVLSACLTTTKLATIKLFDGIKTTPAPMNGRINSDTILLKVY